MERPCNFLAVFALVYLNKCCGFNLDSKFVDVIDVGGHDGYFGYSVLLQKGSTSSVLVGAPKTNSTLPNHFTIKEPGALYKCDIGVRDSCKQYVIDWEANTEFRGGDSRYNYKNRKDGGLLGASVDGGENVGDPIFVCSQRWINDRTDRNGQHYLPNGMCYRVQNSKNLNEAAEKLMPLLHSGKQGYTTADYVVKYYYAMGEVGTSMQYLNKEKELLLGAPGVLSWKGTVVRYKDLNSNYAPQQQRLVQRRSKRQAYSSLNVPNPVYFSSIKEENTYFGYAISSGIFDSRSGRLWYVAGAPRGEELYGLVLLYEFSTHDDSDLIVHNKLVGDQLGAYFGAALLSADVTGSGGADLFVGAPTYFTETYDEGCVYFYKNNGRGNFDHPLKLFGNKQTGARFGTTIAGIGDINKDSYHDVAISAPYEDQGVVYIYLGSKNGLSMEFSQRLNAKDINKSLQGFGFSISKGLDIDNNLYNDIAIGAYKSGQVAIVKTRPVIKYSGKLTPSMRELSVNTTSFKVAYCVRYTSPTNNIQNVETVITLMKDSRAIDINDVSHTKTLVRGQDFCSDLEITVQQGNLDYTKPFSVEMSYEIMEPSANAFCPTCPITDPTDFKSVILNVPFANGCGEDNICQPDLRITASFENDMASLVIGSQTTLKLNVRVDNKGEPAYLCQVHTMLPPDVEVDRISSRCQLSEDRVYHCLVDNVLQPNNHKVLVFHLDIKKLNPSAQQLVLNITTDSKGEEVSSVDNSFPLTLNLRLENKMEIEGKSFPDQIVFVDEDNKVKSDVLKFDHKFSIKNQGPSPLSQAVVKFYFPVELDGYEKNIALDVYKPEVYVNHQAIECTTDYPMGFYTESVDGGASGDIDGENVKAIARRARRAANAEEGNAEQFEQLGVPEMLFDLPMNRTVFLNCSHSDVKCMQVTCMIGETLSRNQYIRAVFSIKAHIDALQQLLTNKDIILLGSTAEVQVHGETTQNSVQTLLIGSLTKEEVSYWIYIVCVIVALVILAIVIFVLYKLNFFNRPVREKLQNVSESSSEKKDSDVADHEDHENELYNLS